MISALRRRVRRGISVGPYLLSVARRPKADVLGQDVLRRHSTQLATRFPELQELVATLLEEEQGASEAVLAAANALLPLLHEPAGEVHRRNVLTRLRARVAAPRARRLIDLQLAESNLRSGVVDRAHELLELPADDPRRGLLEAAIAEHDAQYGFAEGIIRSRRLWDDLTGDIRGRSVVAILEERRDELRGATVLHVAPEAAAREWFEAHSAELDVTYLTLDAFGEDVDLREDLTDLRLADDSVDLVICHRVLEHVLDDGAALAALHRIIRPGGALHVSVPQSMQLAVTNEWMIQDESHHGHVRQYGRDFGDRVGAAGFVVDVDPFLLELPLEQHLARGTYPLRIYVGSVTAAGTRRP